MCLTPDRELITDQSKAIAEVKHGEPIKFIITTYKKMDRESLLGAEMTQTAVSSKAHHSMGDGSRKLGT